MNRWKIHLLALCLSGFLFLAGCRSKAPSFLPLTGAKEPSLPAAVSLARDHVLEYLVASSRLAALPEDAEWQLEAGESESGEYHFNNGNWRLVVWPADPDDGNQRVILLNRGEKASWSGYVTSDGKVVDTAKAR